MWADHSLLKKKNKLFFSVCFLFFIYNKIKKKKKKKSSFFLETNYLIQFFLYLSLMMALIERYANA